MPGLSSWLGEPPDAGGAHESVTLPPLTDAGDSVLGTPGTAGAATVNCTSFEVAEPDALVATTRT